MSVNIKIDDVVKDFDELRVIHNLDMAVKEGELFTLLGPSGCGKTTLLRMIAGFNSVEAGEIYFNEKVVNNIPPHKRNIGMVFQNYAIFPHMTSAENVAFGLKNRKIKEPALSERINKILDTVQIGHLKDRMPSEMSGGQQQRLALARAIVVQPDVLLMDEPLSNLDAKLRVEMREAIKEIQQEFGITTIYVTHDQEEALAISDRIAIMKEGVIQQIGSPVEIYQHPTNLFVATFIGKSVLIDAKVLPGAKGVAFVNGGHLPLNDMKEDIPEGKEVKLLVRPNEFIFSEEEGFEGKVLESFFLGVNIQYKIELYNKQIIEVLDHDFFKEIIPKGEAVRLKVNSSVYNVFDAETEESLMNGGGKVE